MCRQLQSNAAEKSIDMGVSDLGLSKRGGRV